MLGGRSPSRGHAYLSEWHDGLRVHRPRWKHVASIAGTQTRAHWKLRMPFLARRKAFRVLASGGQFQPVVRDGPLDEDCQAVDYFADAQVRRQMVPGRRLGDAFRGFKPGRPRLANSKRRWVRGAPHYWRRPDAPHLLFIGWPLALRATRSRQYCAHSRSWWRNEIRHAL